MSSTQYLNIQLPNDTLLEMAYIPGGEFLMGSPPNPLSLLNDESPRHRVKVPSFYMGKYAVTEDQWDAVIALAKVERKLAPSLRQKYKKIGPIPSKQDELIVSILKSLDTLLSPYIDSFFGNDRREDDPVRDVNWYEAVEFCDRLSNYTGCQYRLPSEAEWEYACRARTSTPYFFGKSITLEQMNLPNGFGLYDMHSDVHEWCLDRWHHNYEGAPSDGSAWLENGAPQRVYRSGKERSAFRYCRNPDEPILGFRVVLSL
ncbi:MAG: formylglycine-generating enzyme family protein [Symploca sp. SIO2B6]|nr:formylglycine-generating enzyme family protein [Symploca sp. SIO2B6]